jgi:DNA-binding beta-propeller fold protein YncE
MLESCDAVRPLPFTAPAAVVDAIAGLGRTEDLRFSPSNRRLAIAAFVTGRIAVLDVDLSAPERITLTGGVLLTSSAFRYPHGLDFLDDDTLIVANRFGEVVLVNPPPGEPATPLREVQSLTVEPAGEPSGFRAPASVAVVGRSDGAFEALICDNDTHSVMRVAGSCDGRRHANRIEPFVARWLDFPDGVAVSPDGEWVAVSNHNPHNVLLYRRSANPDSDPEGILRGVRYPHGLRFTPDGSKLLVADAGQPFVHVFTQGRHGWGGVLEPASFRVMVQETFTRGHLNPQEGGPKGLDVDSAGAVLALTSEHQPLAFFALSEVMEHCGPTPASAALQHEFCLMDDQRHLKKHLGLAREAIVEMKNSLSWRITAPLRRLISGWKRRKRPG